MRRVNDRPTTIYWLIDVRPETQQATRSAGFPFYCGKTVDTPAQRLASHRQSARINPHRPISKWLNACGEHVRVQIVATVPADGDWSAAERRWIEVLRLHFPGGANANAGGQGTPGMIHTAEARAKIGAAQKGRPWAADRWERWFQKVQYRPSPTIPTLKDINPIRAKRRRLAKKHKMSAARRHIIAMTRTSETSITC